MEAAQAAPVRCLVDLVAHVDDCSGESIIAQAHAAPVQCLADQVLPQELACNPSLISKLLECNAVVTAVVRGN